MPPLVALESFEPLLALLEESCLEIYRLISAAELPVPVMALAVSELSSPGARAGTDPVSVPRWPERALGSAGPSLWCWQKFVVDLFFNFFFFTWV